MSLVNDMLRDLDARRRDAPGSSLGAERLVPAVDYPPDRKPRVPASFWLVTAMLVSVLLVVTLYFALDNGAPRSLSIDVPVQAVNAAATAPTAALGQELERLNRRMQELETTNKKLQQEASLGRLETAENQKSAVSADEQISTATAGVAPVPSDSAPAEVSAWAPREWRSETEVAANVATRAMPEPVQQRPISLANPDASSVDAGYAGAALPSGSTVVRSPREFTFSERDRQQVQKSLELWQSGQQGASLSALQEYLIREPMAHQSREILAKLLLQQGDTLTAMDVTDVGLQLAPTHTGFRKIKARVLLAAGVPAEAVALLEKSAPTLTADTEYHDLLASARLSSKQYAEAALTYKSLVQIDPQQSRWWYGLGAAQDGLGRSYEAAQAYEKALQLGNLSAGLRQTSQERIASIRQ